MPKCFNHKNVDATNICKNCWMHFCSACFNSETKICNNCSQKPPQKSSKTIRKSVIIFASTSVVTVLLVFILAFLPKKTTNLNTSNSLNKNARKKSNSTSQNGKDKLHFQIKGKVDTARLTTLSEDYYKSIPLLTGLPSGESIGLNDIVINIFGNKEAYVKETGKPIWSEGFADFKNNEIFIPKSEGLEISILPHEISHLFFDNYIGYERSDFNWLDEGLATFVQVKYDSEQAASFKDAMISIRNGKYIPVPKLAGFTLNQNTPETQINVYYAQTLSIASYLITYDLASWKTLLKKLKAKTKLNRALEESYGFNLNKLENKWFNYLHNNKHRWELSS